ncbi:hypothetical protein fHeYen801_038c [Yersinia phage fHe-Yen8-01]|nr:hypothetical protein fHeYen801_038c [Yersinia phage fHe-Yen8-01]
MKTVGYSGHQLGFVDVDNDTYHSGPGVSKSHLDLISRKSPLHYWHKYINPEREPEEKTVPMIVGQATHFSILQPDLFETRVIRGLTHDRRSTANKQAWAEFEQEHKGNYIVNAEMYDRIQYIRDGVWRDPAASGLLSMIIPEQSVFAMMDVPDGNGGYILDENDNPVQALTKCQTDGLDRGFNFIVDLKSTEDASPLAFAKSMANYRYDVQEAWYQSVFDAAFDRHPEDWYFICYEKEPPYAVGIYSISKLDVMLAGVAANRDFAKIEIARLANHWPGYSETPEVLTLPGWYRR